MTHYRTRDGRPARILATDAPNEVYPVIALVGNSILWFTADLRYETSTINHALDLIPVPDPIWDDAPDWANFRAMDSNGTIYWYENRPELVRTLWMPVGRYEAAPDCYPGWKNSLIERPSP